MDGETNNTTGQRAMSPPSPGNSGLSRQADDAVSENDLSNCGQSSTVKTMNSIPMLDQSKEGGISEKTAKNETNQIVDIRNEKKNTDPDHEQENTVEKCESAKLKENSECFTDRFGEIVNNLEHQDSENIENLSGTSTDNVSKGVKRKAELGMERDKFVELSTVPDKDMAKHEQDNVTIQPSDKDLPASLQYSVEELSVKKRIKMYETAHNNETEGINIDSYNVTEPFERTQEDSCGVCQTALANEIDGLENTDSNENEGDPCEAGAVGGSEEENISGILHKTSDNCHRKSSAVQFNDEVTVETFSQTDPASSSTTKTALAQGDGPSPVASLRLSCITSLNETSFEPPVTSSPIKDESNEASKTEEAGLRRKDSMPKMLSPTDILRKKQKASAASLMNTGLFASGQDSSSDDIKPECSKENEKTNENLFLMQERLEKINFTERPKSLNDSEYPMQVGNDKTMQNAKSDKAIEEKRKNNMIPSGQETNVIGLKRSKSLNSAKANDSQFMLSGYDISEYMIDADGTNDSTRGNISNDFPDLVEMQEKILHENFQLNQFGESYQKSTNHASEGKFIPNPIGEQAERFSSLNLYQKLLSGKWSEENARERKTKQSAQHAESLSSLNLYQKLISGKWSEENARKLDRENTEENSPGLGAFSYTTPSKLHNRITDRENMEENSSGLGAFSYTSPSKLHNKIADRENVDENSPGLGAFSYTSPSKLHQKITDRENMEENSPGLGAFSYTSPSKLHQKITDRENMEENSPGLGAFSYTSPSKLHQKITDRENMEENSPGLGAISFTSPFELNQKITTGEKVKQNSQGTFSYTSPSQLFQEIATEDKIDKNIHDSDDMHDTIEIHIKNGCPIDESRSKVDDQFEAEINDIERVEEITKNWRNRCKRNDKLDHICKNSQDSFMSNGAQQNPNDCKCSCNSPENHSNVNKTAQYIPEYIKKSPLTESKSQVQKSNGKDKDTEEAIDSETVMQDPVACVNHILTDFLSYIKEKQKQGLPITDDDHNELMLIKSLVAEVSPGAAKRLGRNEKENTVTEVHKIEQTKVRNTDHPGDDHNDHLGDDHNVKEDNKLVKPPCHDNSSRPTKGIETKDSDTDNENLISDTNRQVVDSRNYYTERVPHNEDNKENSAIQRSIYRKQHIKNLLDHVNTLLTKFLLYIREKHKQNIPVNENDLQELMQIQALLNDIAPGRFKHVPIEKEKTNTVDNIKDQINKVRTFLLGIFETFDSEDGRKLLEGELNEMERTKEKAKHWRDNFHGQAQELSSESSLQNAMSFETSCSCPKCETWSYPEEEVVSKASIGDEKDKNLTDFNESREIKDKMIRWRNRCKRKERLDKLCRKTQEHSQSETAILNSMSQDLSSGFQSNNQLDLDERSDDLPGTRSEKQIDETKHFELSNSESGFRDTIVESKDSDQIHSSSIDVNPLEYLHSVLKNFLSYIKNKQKRGLLVTEHDYKELMLIYALIEEVTKNNPEEDLENPEQSSLSHPDVNTFLKHKDSLLLKKMKDLQKAGIYIDSKGHAQVRPVGSIPSGYIGELESSDNETGPSTSEGKAFSRRQRMWKSLSDTEGYNADKSGSLIALSEELLNRWVSSNEALKKKTSAMKTVSLICDCDKCMQQYPSGRHFVGESSCMLETDTKHNKQTVRDGRNTEIKPKKQTESQTKNTDISDLEIETEPRDFESGEIQNNRQRRDTDWRMEQYIESGKVPSHNDRSKSDRRFESYDSGKGSSIDFSTDIGAVGGNLQNTLEYSPRNIKWLTCLEYPGDSEGLEFSVGPSYVRLKKEGWHSTAEETKFTDAVEQSDFSAHLLV